MQGKFQSAVGELMEINGLIEGIADKEKDLEERQNFTALKIEKAMKIAEMEEPPPKMPTDREMADPKKMQVSRLLLLRVAARARALPRPGPHAADAGDCGLALTLAPTLAPTLTLFQAYMLQMGEYSARQQLKLSAMESEVRENQTVTAEVNHLAAEKRQLQDMSKRLTFSLTNAEQANLSEADAARVLEIQQQLGVTPRGSIKAQNVREVRLYKDQQATRLGIIFHQSTPAELGDVSSDATPRVGGRQPVVLPVIKVLDKAGIAGNSPDLFEGDQVLSVNGHAALSNVQTVQMLRDAVGSVVLAARVRVPEGVAHLACAARLAWCARLAPWQPRPGGAKVGTLSRWCRGLPSEDGGDGEACGRRGLRGLPRRLRERSLARCAPRSSATSARASTHTTHTYIYVCVYTPPGARDGHLEDAARHHARATWHAGLGWRAESGQPALMTAPQRERTCERACRAVPRRACVHAREAVAVRPVRCWRVLGWCDTLRGAELFSPEFIGFSE